MRRARLVRWRLAPTGAARGRTTRESVIVEVMRPSGAIGYGEAAPLAPNDSIGTILRALDDASILSPSARFALETAELDALAKERGISLASLLAERFGTIPATSLPIAVVLDEPRVVAASCVKIKVGPSGDLDRIRAIAAANPHATLRIDANRSWPRDTVIERMRVLANLPIEFIEEPCIEAHTLVDAPLPIAFDESLADIEREHLDAAHLAPHVAAVVLKPSLLGGFAVCHALASDARARGLRVIVTHGLEGPIGTAACAALALAIHGCAKKGTVPISRTTFVQSEAQLGDVAGQEREDAKKGTVPFLGMGTVPISRTTFVQSEAQLREVAGQEQAVCPAVGLAAHPALDAWDVSVPQIGDAHVCAVDAPGLGIDVDALEDAIVALRDPLSMVVAVASERDHERCVIATPTVETIDAVRRALHERRSIALLHHRATAEEQQRQRALVDAAELGEGEVVLFTSGSTGASRGVVLGREALIAAAEASAAHLGWQDDDRWLLALSMAHAGGLAVVVRCLVAGRPIEILGESVAETLERCTLASLVPAQLSVLLDDAAWQPPARLRAVLLGGAAAPPALLARAAERGVPFLCTYGMTETFGQIATALRERAGEVDAPLVPLAGVSIEGGTRAEPRRIVVRAPMLASRYLDGETIAPAFVTSDLGFVNGGLHVVGRADDVIISGGENVHPQQIEAVLCATPGVHGACAFGVADERWGQRVVAAVAVDPTFQLTTAVERWRAALPAYARPREVATVNALPRLPNGKLDRRAAAQLPRARV